MSANYSIDPKLDLVLERVIEVKPETVWKAWTQPEHLKKWFTPAPWKTADCEIDLRPGGIFHTTMLSPEGEKFPNSGCYLEVIPGKKLVWTSALKAGFRPAPGPENGADLIFTGMILIEPHAKGTKYTAIVMHSVEADKQRHEQMGFHDGWGAALDQLVTAAKSMD
ncbi:MAG: polyketide cyclase [Proteobacteria bacterium]|nr:MAG: polyketide cyclase [Pseudomonadota bacterium]